MFSLMRVKNMRAVLALCVALRVMVGPIGSHVFAAVDSSPINSSADEKQSSGDFDGKMRDFDAQMRDILNTPTDFCDPAAMEANAGAYSRVYFQKQELERQRDRSHPTVQHAAKIAVSTFADQGLLEDETLIEDYASAAKRGDMTAANAILYKMPPVAQARVAMAQNNYTLAFKILTLVADKGDIKAQRQLALIYSWATNFSKPSPAPRNDVLAFKYARLASVNGDEPAQEILARAYACGFGTKKDLVEAYAWFSLALSQSAIMLNTNDEPPVILRWREFIATEMRHDDIQRAKHLLMRCYKSAYRNCD